MAAPEHPVTPQVIPRPPTARPGRRAPWDAPGRTGLPSIGVGRVLDALELAGFGLPVPEGPSRRAGGPATVLDGLGHPAGLTVGAAVLVALFEEEGEARAVLTRRSSQLRSHTGQISFPGGKLDPGEGPLDAARREGEEEVGLAAAASTPVGWLPPVASFASGSLIQPVVVTLAGRPLLVPSPAEVDRVFDVALVDLMAEGVFHEERWMRPERPNPAAADGSYPLWFFDIAGETVWGVTAALIFELLCVVLGVRP